jgi:hypothetical protein
MFEAMTSEHDKNFEWRPPNAGTDCKLLRSEAAGVLADGLSIEIHQIYNVNVVGWLGRLRGLPIKSRFRGCRQPDFHDRAGIPQRAAIRRECT